LSAMETIEKNFTTHAIVANNYRIREETVNGRRHLIVPVVMMKEGVHNGSHGPIFHREEELSRNVESWNGIPVTISHPAENGQNVTANSPTVLEANTVGRIFNAHYTDGLKAEAWLDLERLSQVSPMALAYIRQNRPLDVSVGVFSDSVSAEGEWNGETYESTASNYRPDHLALLPGEQGACSWNDGCGIRVNKKGVEMPEDLLQSFKELSRKGYAISLISNEEGYREVSQLLQSKLDALDTADRMYYLEEVYSDYCIYRVRTEGGTTLYKRDYTINNGAATLAESPVEVRKSVSYVTMAMRRTKPSINNNKGGTMSKVTTPCCEAKVDALIANASLHWAAEDREYLLTLEATVLDKMVPKDAPKVAPIEVNAEEVLSTFKGTLVTIEDYTNLMPEEMKAEVISGVAAYKANREALVKSIMDNSDKGTWTEETLEALEDGVLEGISKSVTKTPVDYSGNGGVQDNAEQGEAPMLPAGVNAE